MNAIDFTAVFEMFTQGLIVGGLLTGIPFLLGYIISFFIELCKGKNG